MSDAIGYDGSDEQFVVLRKDDFDRMIEPRAMNYATAEAQRDEWVRLVTGEITKLRENLIMMQAVDQMYVWGDDDGIYMDCPDLGCEDAVFLGRTPNLAHMLEVARDHIRTVHWGEPIVLRIEPEGPVHDSERGGSVVDDPAS